MKQIVRVVGIIRNDNGDILLLKKRLGRMEGTALWELPTGKIKFGEQPEEAMSRACLEYLDVQVESIKLKDVTTFVSYDRGGQLNNLFILYEIIVQENQKFDARDKYSAYKFYNHKNGNLRLTDSSLLVLQLLSGDRNIDGVSTDVRGAINGATVYVDGASRGNPGPAGIGYYIVGENGQVLRRGGEFIGFATSRVAEYYGLKEGCEQALELGCKTVRFMSDNLMMINQMNGIYKIKNADLFQIYDDIQKLLEKFDAVAFVHMKRNFNMEADREANLAIDRHFDENVIE